MRRGALLGAALLAPVAALAQGTGAERMSSRDALLGWEAVGRVEIGGDGSFCTGTLIATDMVLTAAHCLFDEAGAPVDAADLTFRAGLRDGEAVAERGVRLYAVDPAYSRAAGMSADGVRHDIALLRLDSPIPAATAAPYPVGAMPATGEKIAVVSFAQNRAEALSIERECHVLGRSAGLFAFDCEVNYGSSGAPVFDMSGDRGRIVSVISAGNSELPTPTAYGMELAQALAPVERALRSAESRSVAEASALNTLTRDGQTRAGGAKFVSAKSP